MEEMIPQLPCLPLFTWTETCSPSSRGDLWQPAAMLTFLFLWFFPWCFVATNQTLQIMTDNYCRVSRSTIWLKDWLSLVNRLSLPGSDKHFQEEFEGFDTVSKSPPCSLAISATRWCQKPKRQGEEERGRNRGTEGG